jgi:hypothetical protein
VGPHEAARKSQSALRARYAFIHIAERRSGAHVCGIKPLNVKPTADDQFAYLAVEMASSSQAFPTRRKAILPTRDPAIGRLSVFDKEHAAARLQHTPHLAKRG